MADGRVMVAEKNSESPVIWRCSHCGTLTHPSDQRAPVAWCYRCDKFTEARRDGG